MLFAIYHVQGSYDEQDSEFIGVAYQYNSIAKHIHQQKQPQNIYTPMF